MKCPIDQTELKIAERQGIEIDYCPQCRGVWLDRGELDKIIERQAALTLASPTRDERGYGQGGERRHADDAPPYRSYRTDWDDDDEDERRRYDHRKRRGWLGEIFDFG